MIQKKRNVSSRSVASSQIVGEIDSYIDANYVRDSHSREYPVRRSESARSRFLSEEELYEQMLWKDVEDTSPYEDADAGIKMTEPCMLSADMSLEDQLANMGASFHEKLFDLIAAAGIDNKDVWKNANLDRKHFSKIQCDEHYHPKKKTVMALCIALHLDLEQSKDLMARADWAFSPSSKFDLIVQKAIIDKQYDIMQLNVTLFKYTNEILGAEEFVSDAYLLRKMRNDYQLFNKQVETLGAEKDVFEKYLTGEMSLSDIAELQNISYESAQQKIHKIRSRVRRQVIGFMDGKMGGIA